jgi:hypothetical protein
VGIAGALAGVTAWAGTSFSTSWAFIVRIGNHHLYGLTDIPWIHLLHERAEIKEIILAAGAE